MILSINRDYVPKKHYPADLCDGDELCCVCVGGGGVGTVSVCNLQDRHASEI
jgi:hypothetical protein